jgi:hypothetical protein
MKIEKSLTDFLSERRFLFHPSIRTSGIYPASRLIVTTFCIGPEHLKREADYLPQFSVYNENMEKHCYRDSHF